MFHIMMFKTQEWSEQEGQLEHDWFIHKDFWRILDSKGLMDSFTYNDRFNVLLAPQ
jgi:hypothetical protein